MAVSLPEFGQFDCCDLSSAGPRWKKWLARFEVLMSAMDIDDDDAGKKRKKSCLLHYMGAECFEIYETVKVDGDDFAGVKKKLTDYFVPKANTEYERYVFRNTKQREGETLDQFCTRLKKLAINCDFTTNDDEVKSQIIQGCTSTSLRKKALSKTQTLVELLETGRTLEQTKSQASAMEVGVLPPETVNFVKTKQFRDRGKPRHQKRDKPDKKQSSRDDRGQKPSRTCYNCGGPYPHDKHCPAENRRCYQCGRMGHYSRLCKQKDGKSSKSHHANTVTSDTVTKPDADSDYSLAVHKDTCSGMDKIPDIELCVNGVKCRMLIDSGASVNIVDMRTYEQICQQSDVKLATPDTKLYAYGGDTPLPLLGKFTAPVTSTRYTELTTDFYVTKEARGCLLSFNTANDLGIIHIVRAIEDSRAKVTGYLLRDFDAIFNGRQLGKLKDFQLKLNIDDTVPSVHQKHRRIPFATRPKVEKAVEQLYADDICEGVDNTPTPWVSPVVVVPKPHAPDKIRLCVDMRAANKAIRRVKHPMPTVDELIHDLNGCKVFTKLDLEQGYHQIELHPDSRSITTFSTHLGLHRYKRLSFGVNAASEHFQHILEVVLDGLEGVKNISDDIIVASENDVDHEKHVRACLQRLQDKGLTVNRAKCVFFQSSMEFFGNIFGENGVSPDPKKVKAVQDAPRPTDKRQVKSLLGMANYVQRFIPGLATLAKPLRELTKQNSDFVWSEECDQAWKQLKTSLTSSSVMAYFDPRLKTELVVDASPVGLGAILTQIHDKDGRRDTQVVAYASRALDEVESRYSQVEREALAVRWGIEHYHLYLYGIQFSVITDHKPLVSVFTNVMAKPSPRIERWCLRLQQYTFGTVYRPGVNNPADYMSRHPIPSTCERGRKVTEDYVNYVCQSSCPKAVSVAEVLQATRDDAMLANVIDCVSASTSQWYKYKNCEEMTAYEKVANELSVTEQGIVMRAHRIVIPTCLRQRIVDIAHEGHQGLVKTKSLLRAKVWFPYMDALVEDTVKSCDACSAVVKDERLQPLKMSELPDRPWQSLSADFGGPYPSGDYCLVVIDEYSRFPVVELVKSTSARSVIPVLDKIFATHGIPETLKTDNGPPFQSYEFRRFMEYCGTRHRRITPLWPRANAQAENFMKPLNKAIKAATVEGKSWKKQMFKFLRNYRATPHVTTGKPPAEVLFGYNIRVLLPEIQVTPPGDDDDELRLRDAERKAKQKHYADKKNCSRPPDQLQVGDSVLIRQDKHNKLTPAYNPEPMVVEQVKGSMVTARSPSLGCKTRNSSKFKRCHDNRPPVMDTDPDDPPVHSVNPDNTDNMDVITEDHQPASVTPVSPSGVSQHARPRREMRRPVKFKDYICA